MHIGAVLADRFRALDCINHESILGQIDAYEVDKTRKSKTKRAQFDPCYSPGKLLY